ncbi:phospholipase A2-like [Anomaloglossus baeobatrachus]|uniref:phospholipase A2-like n=1 Tax=Anomaloglossus baeobatrachus TaxID=238106 RepID=UPI003F4F5CD6
MEREIFLVFFLCSCLDADLGTSRIRQKRGILELARATECATGRFPLFYVGYGCYCGLGGHGTPKDETDWCCFKHDCCYGDVEHLGCHPKTQSYKWKCVNRSIKCAYTRDKCQKKQCKCDKELAECLQKAPYNKKNALFPNFYCEKENPQCKSYDD